MNMYSYSPRSVHVVRQFTFLNPITSYVSAEHFRSLGTHIKEIGEYLQQLESAKAQYFEAVLPKDYTVACH